MKEQTWVTGSLNPNTVNKTDLQANNAWNPLEVLKAGDLDGMLKKDSEQLKIVSDEISNFLTTAGKTIDPTDSTQMATVLQEIKAEISDVSSKTFSFKGYVSPSQPSSDLNVGDMWINSATMPTVIPVPASDIKVWNGTSWENATSAYTPIVFDTFSNENDGEGYYWFGGVWKIVSTDLSLDDFSLNQSTGKWEIKDGVELTAPLLSASPSSTATGHEIVDASWVSEKTPTIPVFHCCWFDHNPDNISWVNASNYSWLYGSMYQTAYQKLVGQYTPTGAFVEGENYYICQFSDGQIVTTTVLVSGGTLQDLKDWCDLQSYTYNAAETIEEFECYKTVGSDSETISGTTITYYQTFNGMKVIVGDTQIANAEAIYNSTGVAWYYILDTDNERFKLPRTKWGFTGLRDVVGKYVAPGLPNITGTVGATCQGGDTSTAYKNTGAFVGMGNVQSYGPEQNGSAHYSYSTFDASRSSSVYGNGTTVQPPATQMYLYFYVGNYTQTAIENTAGLNAELFNGKVDLNAANLSTQGKSLISGLGMPSDTYDDLTLGATGSTYTAPANGYVTITKATTSANQHVYGSIIGNGLCTLCALPWSNGYVHLFFPVKKGQTFTINYTAAGTLSWFRFIYAEGEENV